MYSPLFSLVSLSSVIYLLPLVLAQSSRKQKKLSRNFEKYIFKKKKKIYKVEQRRVKPHIKNTED